MRSVSNCCEAPRLEDALGESDLCSACKEHAEFVWIPEVNLQENSLLHETYKNWHISYDCKPIPTRSFDWNAVHDDYDPTPMHAFDPPSDDRAFNAASFDACIREIDDWEENHG